MYTRNKQKVPSDVAFLFSFSKVARIEIINEINNCDESKASQSNNIAKIIKEITFLVLLLLKTLI